MFKKGLKYGLVWLLGLIFTSCQAHQTSDALVVWAMGEEGNRLEEFVKMYEESTGQRVIVTAIPWNLAYEKILTATASKKGPDVLQLGSTWVTEFADAGILANLQPYVAEYPHLAAQNYFDGVRGMAYYDGQLIAVPWYVDTRVLFYRTDLLAAVGYPQGPQSWQELQDAAKKLMANGSTIGFSIDNADQGLVQMYVWQAGGQMFDGQGYPQFTSPEVVTAVSFLASFFREGGSLWNSGLDVAYHFADGQVPMFVSGPWMITLFDEIDNFSDWNVTMVPQGPANRISSVGGSALTVFKYSDKQAQAAAFIHWMSEVETQLAWFEVVSALPSRVDAWQAPMMQADARIALLGQQLQESQMIPSLPYFERIAMELIATTERIFGNNAPIEAELETLQERALRIAQSYS